MKRFLIITISNWFGTTRIVEQLRSLGRILSETEAKIDADILKNSEYYKVTTEEEQMDVVGGKNNKKKGGQLQIINIIANSERISHITFEEYIRVRDTSIVDDSGDLESLIEDINNFARIYKIPYIPIKRNWRKRKNDISRIKKDMLVQIRNPQALSKRARDIFDLQRRFESNTNLGGNIRQKRSKKNKRTRRRQRRTRNHIVI
jgi:hypothetical protein